MSDNNKSSSMVLLGAAAAIGAGLGAFMYFMTNDNTNEPHSSRSSGSSRPPRPPPTPPTNLQSRPSNSSDLVPTGAQDVVLRRNTVTRELQAIMPPPATPSPMGASRSFISGGSDECVNCLKKFRGAERKKMYCGLHDVCPDCYDRLRANSMTCPKCYEVALMNDNN